MRVLRRKCEQTSCEKVKSAQNRSEAIFLINCTWSIRTMYQSYEPLRGQFCFCLLILTLLLMNSDHHKFREPQNSSQLSQTFHYNHEQTNAIHPQGHQPIPDDASYTQERANHRWWQEKTHVFWHWETSCSQSDLYRICCTFTQNPYWWSKNPQVWSRSRTHASRRCFEETAKTSRGEQKGRRGDIHQDWATDFRWFYSKPIRTKVTEEKQQLFSRCLSILIIPQRLTRWNSLPSVILIPYFTIHQILL